MDVMELMEQKILELKRQLRAHEKAYQDLQHAASNSGDAGTRFYKRSPISALRMILTAAGHGMRREDLHRELVAGGITRDRARGEHNIRLSFKQSLAMGKLREHNGLIGLPEWGDDLFVPDQQTLP